VVCETKSDLCNSVSKLHIPSGGFFILFFSMCQLTLSHSTMFDLYLGDIQITSGTSALLNCGVL
jgi:hypothetical protein